MSEQKYFTSNSKLEVDLYNQSAIELIQEIGRRITAVTEDTRETVFLFQPLIYCSSKVECGRLPGYIQRRRGRSINQSINKLISRHSTEARATECGYAESKKNVLRRILNVLTNGAVRQFSGRELAVTAKIVVFA